MQSLTFSDIYARQSIHIVRTFVSAAAFVSDSYPPFLRRALWASGQRPYCSSHLSCLWLELMLTILCEEHRSIPQDTTDHRSTSEDGTPVDL
ncbi:hypothetical protein OE88DRAFT_1668029 [Heliocybe sulcata]|uniref:Uncharacterized protein n=1 Tax=Heliocybe sulcata TaxID=5364 RepID=A0A5C3MN26_9AGAM|nr:hypothetical protein OE88DRAFT_1668029 [Heliocybe sulcata]